MLTDTEITQIVREEKTTTWQLTTQSANKIYSKNMILALGHLPSDKYLELKNETPTFYESPWKDLSSIQSDSSVAILGSGLTAIDTAKLLAAQHHVGKLFFISPSAQLPRIKGPATTSTYSFQYLTPSNLTTNLLTYDHVMQLFADEMSRATGTSLSVDDLLKIVKSGEGKDAHTLLSEEVKLVDSGQVRQWQVALSATFYNVLPILTQQLGEEDQKKFRSIFFPLYLKWIAGMTLGNAKEIVSMMDSGQLTVLSGPKCILADEKGGIYHLTTHDDQTLSVSTIINATGTGHSIHQNALLSQMEKDGYLSAHPLGGIAIASDSLVISPSHGEQTHCWALGPTTFGSNPLVYATETSAMDAAKIAAHVLKDLTHVESNTPVLTK